MAVEDPDYGRAAAVQGDSDTPVTVADLAKAAGVELVGEDEEAAPAPAPVVVRRQRRTVVQPQRPDEGQSGDDD